jgi:hypothetical protein
MGDEMEEMKLQMEKYRLGQKEEESKKLDEGLKKLFGTGLRGTMALASSVKTLVQDKEGAADDGAAEKRDKFKKDMAEQREKELEKKREEADIMVKLEKEKQAIQLQLLREKTQKKKGGGRGKGRK